MNERVSLPETGVVHFGDLPVIAQAIAVRERYGEPERGLALRAELVLGEGRRLEIDLGEEVEIAGERWRVAEIHEDPLHARGQVVLERA